MKTRCHYLIIAAITLPMFLTASVVEAVTISLTVDPTSSLSLTANFSGFDVEEQGSGSLTTTYSGTATINLDDVLAPTTIDFLSSALVAANNGNWLPEIGGGPEGGNTGTAQPANYGGFVATGAVLARDVYVALRDLEFDTTTPDGPLAVAGETFPSTQTFTLTTGAADYNVEGGLFVESEANTEDLSTDSALNQAADSMISLHGSILTLTVPVDFDIEVAMGQGNATIIGTLTATADISTGDFDQDGDTDGTDFLLWQRGHGTLVGASLDDGDGNFDGAVLGDDLQLWQDQFGTVSNSNVLAMAVPEPTSLVIAMVLSPLLTVALNRKAKSEKRKVDAGRRTEFLRQLVLCQTLISR